MAAAMQHKAGVMFRVLVAGGGGFVGSALVAALTPARVPYRSVLNAPARNLRYCDCSLAAAMADGELSLSRLSTISKPCSAYASAASDLALVIASTHSGRELSILDIVPRAQSNFFARATTVIPDAISSNSQSAPPISTT